MNNFEFYNPVKVIFGAGEVNRIGEAAAPWGKKALIVSYDKVDFYGDLFQRIHASLKEHGVDSVDHFAATANPLISQAVSGVALGKKEGVDMVIGVGGGSAMDLAKVIAAGILYPYEDICRMIKFSHSTDEQVPPKEALPLIMVPTLPATASEMNPHRRHHRRRDPAQELCVGAGLPVPQGLHPGPHPHPDPAGLPDRLRRHRFHQPCGGALLLQQ